MYGILKKKIWTRIIMDLLGFLFFPPGQGGVQLPCKPLPRCNTTPKHSGGFDNPAECQVPASQRRFCTINFTFFFLLTKFSGSYFFFQNTVIHLLKAVG